MLWSIAIPFTGGIGSAGLGAFAVGALVSGCLHVVYMLVLQRGYARGDLSTVYATARGSGPMLTVLVSILLFGERPGLLALGGVVLVIAGVVAFGLIGRGARSAALSGARPRPARGGVGPRVDPAILYGLLTGVTIAAYTVWDVHTVNGFGAAPVAFMVGTSAAQTVIFTGLLARGRALGAPGDGEPWRRLGSELRANWRGVLIFGVLSPLSYILVLTAATLAPLSLVAPMREVSVVLVGAYGAIRHRENDPMLRIAAAAVVFAGVLMIGA